MIEASKTLGVAEDLCRWIHGLQLEDIPEHIRARAKHLLLDGIRLCSSWCACTLVGKGYSEHSGSSRQIKQRSLVMNGRPIEDALGITSTQACGLMSAHHEGMVKRMQHGFSARNGLFGALLAKGGYSGIKKVFERPYGGFLSMFSKGNSRVLAYLEDEVTKDLGSSWVIEEIQVKVYACVGCAFGMIECIKGMQELHPEELTNLNAVKSVKLGVSTSVLGHCGWKAIRPLTSTGAQMNLSFIAALQFLDRQVLLDTFSEDKLDRDELWILAEKITSTHDERFDQLSHEFGSVVTVEFHDSRPESERMVERPIGLERPVTNEEIVDKYRKLTTGRLSTERQEAIEEIVLNFNKLDDIRSLTDLLAGPFVIDA